MTKATNIATIIMLAMLIATPARADFVDDAANANSRTEENKSRDQWRNPAETLRFFGIKPEQHVLEILPGRGWYTEILAPITRNKGKLTTASFGDTYPNEYLTNIHKDFMKKLKAEPEVYDHIRVVSFHSPGYAKEVADNSIDLVLTFRNTHNWLRDGKAEQVYQDMARVLKKGGILGVVQHRATDPEQSPTTGYVTEQKVIQLAQQAGLKLLEKSDINANPKDTKQHPEGVWTLPPSLRLKEQDQEKYQAIGESDRMTIKFIKP